MTWRADQGQGVVVRKERGGELLVGRKNTGTVLRTLHGGLIGPGAQYAVA